MQFVAPYTFEDCLFKIYFIDYAITLAPFFSHLYSPPLCIPLPPSFPHLRSCPWVIHISSLASPFPTLFLTSPVYFVPTCYAFFKLLFRYSCLHFHPTMTPWPTHLCLPPSNLPPFALSMCSLYMFLDPF